MKISETKIKDLYIIDTNIFKDDRGWFSEIFVESKFENTIGKIRFVQENHSYSKEKNTLRGLHFQNHPKAQSKLVRCTKGKILDVAVDLRKDSETYLKYFSVILSEENKKQLFIPKGFAHGFLTLEDNSEVQYKVDEYYFKEFDRSIRYDDSRIGVSWNTDNPITSKKDADAPQLNNSDCNF